MSHALNVVITGAGRGLGAAVARRAAREGAAVTVADLDGDHAEEVAAALRADGHRADAIQVDVTDEDGVRQMMADAVVRNGPLTGVVNAAATIAAGPLEQTTSSTFARVMEVNVTGTFHVSKWAVHTFLAQGSGGAIVNIGSISALAGLPGQSAYCASKGAVVALSRQIATDYAKHGIRCNVVGPGSIDGEFLDGYLADQPDPERAREAITAAHPIGRIATPGEIAGPVWFLLTPDAAFVAGANLQVDGGYTAV